MILKRPLNFMARRSVLALIVSAGLAGASIVAMSGDGGAIVARPDPVSIRDTSLAAKYQKSGKWAKAEALLSRHAQGENPTAKYLLAYQIGRGWGVPRDLDAALDLLLQAVRYEFPKRPKAALELGRLYRLSRGDQCQELAFQWFGKALEWGNDNAHLDLAKSYARGLGTEPDIAKAAFHYEQAALLGSAPAVFAWVRLIHRGTEDHPGDSDAALGILMAHLPMLEAQALAGNGYAARSLARLYLDDEIVPQDHSQSRKWFERAVSLGDAAAMHDLAKLAIDADYDWFEDAELLDLIKTSATSGYSAAFTLMGRLHLQAKLGLKPENAADWFTKGVEAGHSGSMEELARLHWTGKLANADRDEALELARQGAKLRHAGSSKLLKEITSAIGG